MIRIRYEGKRRMPVLLSAGLSPAPLCPVLVYDTFLPVVKNFLFLGTCSDASEHVPNDMINKHSLFFYINLFY